jgi:Tol biopolymer transport system component
VLAAAVLLVLAAPASAVPPGREGLVAFQNTDENSSDIWVVASDGSGLTNITATPASEEYEPAWAPDGRRVAFATDRGREQLSPPAIWTARSDGGGARPLAAKGLEQRSPAWSPDGRLIAFSVCTRRPEEGEPCSSAQVATVRANGAGFRYVTRPLRSVNAVDAKPAWSPDGRSLVFARTVDNGYGVLWVVRADGTGLRRLLDDRSTVDHNPSWSPDGKWIAYASDASGDDAIWVVSPNGRNRRLVIEEMVDPEDDQAVSGASNPVFAPSGKRIAFSAGSGVWTVALDGSDLRQISDSGSDEPDWSRAPR